MGNAPNEQKTHIISSLYWKGSTLNIPPRHEQRGKSTWPKWLDCLSCLKRKNRHICQMLRHINKIFSYVKISIYPCNPKLCMVCDIVLSQNSLRQETQKKTNFQLWLKWGPKVRMCPTRKLINQMHESRSLTKCEFQQFKL